MLTSLALAALTSLLVQFLLVALVSTLRPAANVYVSIIIVSVVTAPFAYAADAAQVGGALGRDGRVFMALIHMALGGFLFHFMTLPDRSVTLRILVERRAVLITENQTVRGFGHAEYSGMMVLKLDENVHGDIVEALAARGHDVALRGRKAWLATPIGM